MSLVQMSIGGGALILFTVLVRSVALNKLPKTTFLILWEITILRLLLPVSIPSPWSVYTQTERVFRFPEPEASATGFVKIPASTNAPAPAVPSAQAAPVPVSAILWLAAASLLAAYFAFTYVRSRRKFSMSLPEESPFVRDWLAQHRSFRPIQARQSDRIASPLTYGILRPVILLPKCMDRTDETSLTCVLAHEYIHIRRFDAVAKLALAAALCVHWFNPLVWVMYILANRDLELSCDGQVLRVLGQQGRKSYALTLLEMEGGKQKGGTLFSHFGKLAMEERIEAIMKYKKASVLAVFLAVALVAGAVTALATSAAPASSPQDSDKRTEGTNSASDDINKDAEGVELFWSKEDGVLELAPGTEIPVGCPHVSEGQQKLAISMLGQSAAELEIILTNQDSGEAYSGQLAFEEEGGRASATILVETPGNYTATLKNIGTSNATVSLISVAISLKGLEPEEEAARLVWTDEQAVQVDGLSFLDGLLPAGSTNIDLTGHHLIERTHPITGMRFTYDDTKGELVRISVSHNDESNYTPETWADILDRIEKGEISWAD